MSQLPNRAGRKRQRGPISRAGSRRKGGGHMLNQSQSRKGNRRKGGHILNQSQGRKQKERGLDFEPITGQAAEVEGAIF